LPAVDGADGLEVVPRSAQPIIHQPAGELHQPVRIGRGDDDLTASRESHRPRSLTTPSWVRPWAPGTTSATRQVSSPISLCGVRDRARRTAISGSSWTPAAKPTPTSTRTPSRSASRPRTTATPTISHGRGRSWRACGGCTPSSGRCTRPSAAALSQPAGGRPGISHDVGGAISLDPSGR
jgi:hypothetical protein